MMNEKEMKDNAIEVVDGAKAIVVRSDEDYKAAGEYCKTIKTAMDNVTAYFKDMKDAAYKAHKDICAKENEMLKPLKEELDALKKAMGAYQDEKEAARAAEEARLRALAIEAAEKELEEAIAFEDAGKIAEAEAKIAEVEAAEAMANGITLEGEDAKADGIAHRYDYEIVVTDPAKVPTDVAGVCIRPVDMAAVKKLVKATNGAIAIPGITVRKVSTIAVRTA